MPAPISVELRAHDPAWREQAASEIARIAPAFGSALLAIHHIGSTAIPGIRAKPILDLMPVVEAPGALNSPKTNLEALGYVWWGELGMPGRRYCTLSDAATGLRLVQLHCFATGTPEIERHLAFRDYLRAHSAIAAEYDLEKVRCAALHPADSHAYNDCKNDWIRRVELDALEFQRRQK
ncbi:MAG TPA: GrpB family protein [Acidobacteriaceae bacterium]